MQSKLVGLLLFISGHFCAILNIFCSERFTLNRKKCREIVCACVYVLEGAHHSEHSKIRLESIKMHVDMDSQPRVQKYLDTTTHAQTEEKRKKISKPNVVLSKSRSFCIHLSTSLSAR